MINGQQAPATRVLSEAPNPRFGHWTTAVIFSMLLFSMILYSAIAADKSVGDVVKNRDTSRTRSFAPPNRCSMSWWVL